MPMLWTEGVNTGRLTPNEFVAVTSTNIARILNIYPQKGAILEGSDADIVVWDPKKSKVISPETQQSVVEYNVFAGREVTGLPRYTLSRGTLAVDDGRVCATPGHGRFVKRAPFGEVNKALSKWKEVTAPRQVVRKPENMPACV
jgi:dihydropyrimidinase